MPIFDYFPHISQLKWPEIEKSDYLCRKIRNFVSKRTTNNYKIINFKI